MTRFRSPFYLVILILMALAGCDTETSAGSPPNYPCETNTDCSDGVCHSGVCASPAPKQSGSSCKGNGECKSYYCLDGVCVPGNKPAGSKCIRDDECAGRLCLGGTCGGKKKPDAGVDGSKPDAGKADAPKPDAPKADAPKPDMFKPDMFKPDMFKPDILISDLPVPDMTPLCGNGKLDPTEQCEGSKLNGKTCKIQGFTGGTLDCTKSCTLDTKGCHYLLDSLPIKISTYTSCGPPAVAFDGVNFFVVWRRSSNIHGVRMSPAGKVLDAKPIVIADTATYLNRPSVAFDGTNYVVAWVSGISTQSKTGPIYGARVTPTGKVLDWLPTFLFSGSHSTSPMLACDGKQKCLMVVSTGKGGAYHSNLYGSMVSLGKPLGSSFHIYGGMFVEPKVAHDGTNYLVVVQKYSKTASDVFGVRVGSAGTLLGKVISISTASGNQTHPTVAFGGKHYLVAWDDTFSGVGQYIMGNRVKVDGTVLDKNGGPISFKASHLRSQPSMAASGTDYLVAFRVGSKIYGRRVFTDSTPGTGKPCTSKPCTGIIVPSSADFPITTSYTVDHVVAYGGGLYLVLWRTSGSATAAHIYGARVKF